MATRRVVTRVDDLDGSPDAHTVRFGLDGDAYEIDLADPHAQPFRELLAPHVSEGRRLTSSGRPYTRIDLDTRTTGAGQRGTVGAADQPAGHLPETDRPARPRQQTADEGT